jgi:ligand-binding sensor domain-containing protein
MRSIVGMAALAFVVLAPSIGQADGSWSRVVVPNSPTILGMGIERNIVWLSTQADGLLGYDGNLWVLHRAEEGGIRSNAYNYTVFVDSRRRKWITRDDSATIDRLDDRGTYSLKSDDVWTYYSYPAQLANRRVFSTAEGRDGEMWFGMRDENHNRPGTLELLIDGADTTTADDQWFHFDNAWTPDSTHFSDDDVRALAIDRAGRLWIGYYASGVDVWDYGDYRTFADDEWQHVTDANGLPSSLVHAIHVAADGRVWVGTLGGLAVFDPAADTWTTIEGLPGLQTLALASDAQGHIWVGTDDGVAMLYASGTVAATYNTDDGIQNPTIASIVVDRLDGTVWAVSKDEATGNTSLNMFESGFGPQSGVFYLYPNPWKTGTSVGPITIFGPPDGSHVEVLDLAGEEIRDLPAKEPYAWDTLDASQREVPSGVYLVRIEVPGGNVTVLKAAIVR